MQDFKRKKIFLVVLTVMIFYFFCQLVYAQQSSSQIEKDVSVNIILSSVVNLSNYTKFIRVTNNNDIEGENDNLSIFVKINLSCDEETTEWNVTKTINSYSESGFGVLSLKENSSYFLCIELIPLNFIDLNYSNNLVCKNMSTINIDGDVDDVIINYTNNDVNISTNKTEEGEEVYQNATNFNSENNTSDSSANISTIVPVNETQFNQIKLVSCDCRLEIKTNKDIFMDGEKIEFQILDCTNESKYKFPIEYWVEDKNEIVKSVLNTTSKATKTYTPSIDSGEKYFLIKTRIQECENTSQKLVAFTKKEKSDSPFLKIFAMTDVNVNSPNELIYVSIDGYKGESTKTLISVWLEKRGEKKSRVTKFYVNEENTYFNFKIPLMLDIEESGEYSILAEGLDEKETSKINIVYEDNEVDDEKEEKLITATEITATNNGKITSFYTRKKVFEPNITLYISVDSPKNKLLIISGDNQTLILKNLSEKNTLNFTINSESEIISAELYLEDVFLDYVELKLNLTRESDEKEERKEENKTNKIGLMYVREQTNNISLLNISESYYEDNSNKITGQITAVKTGKAGAVFMLVAVLMGLLLFNKKIRAFLFCKIKKPKLFK